MNNLIFFFPERDTLSIAKSILQLDSMSLLPFDMPELCQSLRIPDEMLKPKGLYWDISPRLKRLKAWRRANARRVTREEREAKDLKRFEQSFRKKGKHIC